MKGISMKEMFELFLLGHYKGKKKTSEAWQENKYPCREGNVFLQASSRILLDSFAGR